MSGKLTGAGSIYRSFTTFPKCKIFTCPKSAHITAKCCYFCEKKEKCTDPCMNDPAKCGQCVKPEGWEESKEVSYPMGCPDLPDHPDIRKMELYGTIHPEREECPDPICPVCQEECETIYLDANGDCCGCNLCVKKIDALDYMLKNQE